MPKLLLWLQYVRSVLLALRIIAFEKTDETALAAWAALTLLTVLPLATVSLQSGLVALAVMGVFFFAFRRWVRRNRARLIRTADRIEFADVQTDEQDYRQRFLSGIVLRRMREEDVKRSGEYDPALMEGSHRFFIVRSADKTRIIPEAQIVGIEIDAS
jgi:hypothetical protein